VFPALTSAIAMTSSPLHASILSVGGQFLAFICKGRVLLGATYEDNDFGASISSSMVTERKSGDESVSYVVSDDATADILSTI
jgi:hypothetical protein